MKATTLVSGLILGFAVFASGCASSDATATTSGASLAALENAYRDATTPVRRSVIKPIRDKQQRAMVRLAAQTERLMAQTQSWNESPRLVGLDDDRKAQVDGLVNDFNRSLNGLNDAAKRSDSAAVRREYAAAIAAYHDLYRAVGPIE